MPDSPAIRRFHEDDTEGPRGLSIPRPVTTTLRAAMGNVKVQPSIVFVIDDDLALSTADHMIGSQGTRHFTFAMVFTFLFR